MANPTTYFGWVMPTSSSLVTNLPADFNTFGQAVDTSMSELLGGTTGQVLSKNSNTNMDFLWINNDQGDITGVTAGTGITVTSPTGPVPTVAIDTAVTVDKTTAQTLTNKTLTSPALTTPTISTATTNGDLLYGTGSGALTRLGIGSTAQVLTVAGGVPSWATPAGGGGKVLQVVSVQTTTTTTIASTSLTDTGITASITPTSATSKILVIIAANAYASASVDNTQVGAALLRGATTLQSWNSSKNFLVIVGGGSIGYIAANNSVVYLDSPATTSSTTYKLQANTQSTANSRQVVFQEGGSPGTITLMEIGA